MQRLIVFTLLFAAVFALAPLHIQTQYGIDGSWIVVYREGTSFDKIEKHKSLALGADPYNVINFSYSTVLLGFAGNLSSETVDFLRHQPEVEYVQQDGVVRIADEVNEPEVCTNYGTAASWGLRRVSTRQNVANAVPHAFPNEGSGTHAYIIDTGIRATHVDFGGRAILSYNCAGGGTTPADGNGHGTHVAGTVGGNTYGIAKKVTLHAIRVLDNAGSGTTACVIAGIDWVGANHVKPAITNLSLGGGKNTALDNAINNLNNNQNILSAIAAGNNNGANACNYSPAGAAQAFTCGSTTSTDAMSTFSNTGTCVDLFGPGSSIVSDYFTSDTATATLSGTSMATPHVCGIGSLLLSENPGLDAATLRSTLIADSTPNMITGLPTGTVNRLGYINC